MTLMTMTEGPLLGLAEELQRQLTSKRDLLADTRLVTLNEGGEGVRLAVAMDTGVESFEVTEHAHGQIGSRLGIPLKFYDRLRADHPDLLCDVANGLLDRESEKRLLRTMDGKVRAFLSNAYRPRDNWDLLDKAILPALQDHPGAVTFKACELTETRMYLKIVLPDFEQPITPRVGDVIRAGLIVKNSEVGAGALAVYPYTDELLCTNGMVHTKYGKGERHVGKRIGSDAGEEAWELYSDETVRLDDVAFFAKVRDVVKATLDETIFSAIVRDIGELRGLEMGAPPPVAVEVLSQRHSLTDAESGSMLLALIASADLSALGYVRALTTAARDLESPDRRVDLESLAGRMVADPELVLVAVGGVPS